MLCLLPSLAMTLLYMNVDNPQRAWAVLKRLKTAPEVIQKVTLLPLRPTA